MDKIRQALERARALNVGGLGQTGSLAPNLPPEPFEFSSRRAPLV